MLTKRPTSMPMSKAGPATSRIVSTASLAKVTTVASVIYSPSSGETQEQPAHYKVPAVNQNKQQYLKGQRNHNRRQHHHAHAHQGGGNHHVDYKEGDENNETELKRCL